MIHSNTYTHGKNIIIHFLTVGDLHLFLENLFVDFEKEIQNFTH